MAATFDFIVVGAGSAGCVIASRLSEDPARKVLLIEAGGRDRSPLIHIPGGMLPMARRSLFSWTYRTTPQQHLNDRVLSDRRGKVLGGSSAINGMVYCRGAPSDYDHWAELGNRGWSYSEVLPYFKRAEGHELGAGPFHGGDGPLRVSRSPVTHPIARAFVEAGIQAGYPFNDDINGRDRDGFGPADATVHRGRRFSTAQAYLRPARRRRNLTIWTNTLATGIVFSGNRAVGVNYLSGGKSGAAHCDGEIILSGGVFNSPHLLLLSGVGNGDHLRAHGIAPVIDLKGVGQNLQDHFACTVQVQCAQPISHLRHFGAGAKLAAIARYAFLHDGPLWHPPFEVTAVVRSDPSMAEADIKYHFVPAMYLHNGRELLKEHGFLAHPALQRPRSIGELTLASADRLTPPNINPNYLAAEEDRKAMRSSLRIARDVIAQQAFDPYRAQEMFPGAGVVTDADLDAYIRATGEGDMHATSSCRMGNDALAVVDDQLRVRGIAGLRVVDASIMPRVVSGNTNAPTILIAEKASDLILGKPALPPENPGLRTL